MQIRNATAQDLAGIVKLGLESPAAARWSEHTYRELLSHEDKLRIALVAAENGEVVGFMLARTIADECELEDIVVRAANQRQGIGRELIGALTRALQEHAVRRIFLEVRESNLPARSFYEKCGFRLHGQRAAYYRAPAENALLYMLELPGLP